MEKTDFNLQCLNESPLDQNVLAVVSSSDDKLADRTISGSNSGLDALLLSFTLSQLTSGTSMLGISPCSHEAESRLHSTGNGLQNPPRQPVGDQANKSNSVGSGSGSESPSLQSIGDSASKSNSVGSGSGSESPSLQPAEDPASISNPAGSGNGPQNSSRQPTGNPASTSSSAGSSNGPQNPSRQPAGDPASTNNFGGSGNGPQRPSGQPAGDQGNKEETWSSIQISERCPACGRLIENFIPLPCGHKYHFRCFHRIYTDMQRGILGAFPAS